ncbi:glycosyltransferase family A protein [Desertihabitans aurantiacus]|uniref:glycosyltransferase family A protein n=1 Tax=Desertihabitans aurantiacus TaxID=2282477 RepID=UPI0013002E4D|nr:glycosyltransferase family A protein [Desertihabitans aurantiacus]
MRLRRLLPTRSQAAVLAVSGLVGVAAVVAAVLDTWWLAWTLGVALLLALVALVLYTSRLLSARLNHQTSVLTRQLGKAPLAGSPGWAPAADDRAAKPGRLPALEHWSRTLLTTSAGQELFLERAKRTRSRSARDVLAHAATRGRYRYDDLAAVMESWRAQGVEQVPREELKGLWTPALRTLARLLYSQRSSERDLLDSLLLYDVLVRLAGTGRLTDIDRSHYADLCVDQGRFERATEILRERPADTPARVAAHALFAANAANPYLQNPAADEQRWLEQVNALLVGGGFEPLTLTDGPEEPFYRLACDTAQPVTDGPLVSVLMPIYEPNAATDKAIGSILAQSWRNLELIIVDDGSPRVDEAGRPTPYADQLRGWAARDERIRLHLNEDNHGAYYVRNQAYDEARGEFVTIADKDDWHHPQQIEWQVRDLQAHPDRVANLTNWVRVSPVLRFLVRWGPDRVVHPSFASIMFRHAEVKQRLGYWDTVRKGADNEFRFRLQQAYGFRLNPTEPTPLTFSLMGESNLTSTDLGLGYEHEDRGAYRQAYLSWHKELAAGRSVRLERHPGQRPFPAPQSFLPDRRTGEHFDVVHLVELDAPAARDRQVQREVAAAVRAGLRVGVVTAENFLSTRRPRLAFDPGLAALVRSGAVTRLALASDATTDLLLVRPPTLLQVCRDAPARLRPSAVVVVADEAPSQRRRQVYEASTVSRRVQHIFGVDPAWAATEEPIREALQPLLLRDQLRPGLWETVPDLGPLPLSAPASGTGSFLVGGFRNETTEQWMQQALDGRDADQPAGPALVAAGVFGADEVDAEPDDLGALDAWVAFSDTVEPRIEEQAREALAQGAVLVLSPSYARAFGDAASYATPEQARDVLVELAAEREEVGDTDAAPAGADRAVAEYLGRLTSVGVRAEHRSAALWAE